MIARIPNLFSRMKNEKSDIPSDIFGPPPGVVSVEKMKRFARDVKEIIKRSGTLIE